VHACTIPYHNTVVPSRKLALELEEDTRETYGHGAGGVVGGVAAGGGGGGGGSIEIQSPEEEEAGEEAGGICTFNAFVTKLPSQTFHASGFEFLGSMACSFIHSFPSPI
jgi:hypothetical protein